MRTLTFGLVAFGALLCEAKQPAEDVVVETKAFRLVIGADATAKSLVVKATGAEMLEPREGIPVFATTQIRPFNNEVRLVNQAKRTTYPANRVRREGDRLVVGFETAPYEVVVRVNETEAGYAAFRPTELVSDTVQEHQYCGWEMDVPPIDAFRLLQLPVRDRANFGDWLNVMWDGQGVVGVMGGTPYMDVDNEKRWGFRKLTVDSLKDYGVTNGVAILAAAPTPDAFLAQVDAAEVAFGMPRGVQSRRDSRLNASIFWTSEIEPGNADEILALMKKGGFRMLLIYYPALIKAKDYSQLPDYRWDNGWSKETLSSAVAKFHANGISVGFHALQTFIGLESSYVTPEADHRLALAEHFTLAQPLAADAKPAELLVEENPVRAAALDAPLPTRGALINWEVLERSVVVQVDHWEYGTSKAAAFDSPATVQGWLGAMRANKRMDDILEMMRKWEDVRARKLLTSAQKEKLKDPKREFHLLDDGKGGYDLVEWKQLTVGKGPDATWAPVRAFVYARGGKRVVAYWHVADKGRLVLPDGLPTLEAENLKLWETDLTEAQLVSAFARATAEK